jgi:hypothetical protein
MLLNKIAIISTFSTNSFYIPDREVEVAVQGKSSHAIQAKRSLKIIKSSLTGLKQELATSKTDSIRTYIYS